MNGSSVSNAKSSLIAVSFKFLRKADVRITCGLLDLFSWKPRVSLVCGLQEGVDAFANNVFVLNYFLFGNCQASAIQKILGQDSSRKKKEERLLKQRQEIEQVENAFQSLANS